MRHRSHTTPNSRDGHAPSALTLLLTLLSALCLASCTRAPAPRTPGPLRIVVSIAPLQGLVRELAPDAHITLLVPPGISEHGYELTPGDVASIHQADLIVGVGMGLETRLEELVARMPPASRHVLWFADTLTQEERALGADSAPDDHAGHDHTGHDHAHDDHDHAAGDPHLWLDPILVERFVAALGPQLEAAHQRAAATSRNAAPSLASTQSLRDRILAVDARARQALAPLAGRAIVTHHASHARFAARYGLRIAATIRIAETMEPTPGQVEAAVRAIQAESVPAVFVEPQFDSSTAARIAQAAGVRVVVLDPIGDGDWFKLMDHNISTISGALTPQPATPSQAPSP